MRSFTQPNSEACLTHRRSFVAFSGLQKTQNQRVSLLGPRLKVVFSKPARLQESPVILRGALQVKEGQRATLLEIEGTSRVFFARLLASGAPGAPFFCFFPRLRSFVEPWKHGKAASLPFEAVAICVLFFMFGFNQRQVSLLRVDVFKVGGVLLKVPNSRRRCILKA